MGKIQRLVIKAYLDERDWKGLCEWMAEERGVLRSVSAMLLHNDPLLRWRAVEALGILCRYKAEEGDEEVSNRIIRRLLWGMNDESGSVIWNAPEAIAEIVVNVPDLIPQYSAILISNIELEPFPRGVHWSVARITSVNPDVAKKEAPVFLESLDAPDPYLRAHSALVLGNLGENTALEPLQNLLDDHTPFEVYDLKTGVFQIADVAEYIRRGLSRLLPPD